MMFGTWWLFDLVKKFLLKKNSIVQIFVKKQGYPKRVAKVGFYLAEKKALSDKYLLIIGEALSMFGKIHLLTAFSE